MNPFRAVKNAVVRAFNPTVFDSPNNQIQPSNDRKIPGDPRTNWTVFLPRKLTPQMVQNVLRSGALGDMWQFNGLVELMLDSWPMLKKCQHELRTSVSTAKFTVHPFSANGKKPTKSAQAKADLIKKAIDNMCPDPATDEKGFKGMVYDMADAYLKGIAVVELQWHNDGKSDLPRAATFVHPMHIAFDNSGRIILTGARGGNTIPFDPDFFMSAQYQSQSGSVLMCGMARPLGMPWCYRLHACEWIVVQAQKHGSPYTVVTYSKALQGNAVELQKIVDSLDSPANERRLMVPEGTTAQLTPPSSLGTDNPQRFTKEDADAECQMLILGQTSTSEATPGKLGGDDSKMEVLQSHKEAVTEWISQLLTEQFCRAILRRNYDNEDECPKIMADFAKVESKKEAADRWNVIGTIAKNIGAPLTMTEFYEENDLTMPKEGDIVLLNGKIGALGETENPIEPNPTLEEQAEEMGTLAEAQAAGQPERSLSARDALDHDVVRASQSKSSTQLTLKPEDAALLLPFLSQISPEDVYHENDETGRDDYGVETEPHITALYGLTNHSNDKAGKIVSKFGPIAVTLGAVSLFRNEKYDVLKVDVNSPDLRRLNKALSALPHEASFKGYKPHLTLAYLKPGAGEKYTGDNRFDGLELEFDTVTFSPPSEMRGANPRVEMPLSQEPDALKKKDPEPSESEPAVVRQTAPVFSEFLEFYRAEERDEPRNWPQRWVEAGGEFTPGENPDYPGEGRMIASRNSPVWLALSRFDDDAPPYDYSSGMDRKPVTTREAERLGLLKEQFA